MSADQLVFAVRSHGTICIDLARCLGCDSHACVDVCMVQGGPLVLDAESGMPALKWTLDEVKRGGCTECLGCELECAVRGRKAVTISLPMERFGEYLDTLSEPTVYASVR